MSITTLVWEPEPRPPLEDIAIGPAWLRHLAKERGPAVLRLYRPAPTMAFSGRDCLNPAIGAAAQLAAAQGFEPVRRGPGGHATAYHQGCLGIDQLSLDALEPDSITGRFARFGAGIVSVLRSLGLPDAAMGEVPGEYCPGEYSVNDGQGHKLVGTAQRLSGGAWLFSTMIVVTDAAPIAAALVPVYDRLGLTFDPDTVGSIADSVPEITVEQVRDAMVEALAGSDRQWGEIPPAVVALAATNRASHLVPEDT